MTTATIIFEDNGFDELDVRIDFGEGGINENASAHLAAAKSYVEIVEFLKSVSGGSNESSK